MHPARAADKSAFLAVPNVEVGMEAKHSIAILSLNAFLRGSFIYTHI